MKELPAGERDAHASLLQALLTRLRVLARRRNGDGHSLRETLEELIEEDEGGQAQDQAEFTEEERALLLNALSFGELQVLDVMVPRSDIEAIDVSAGLTEVIAAMRQANHTRLPVYRGALDEVIGMVHIKDMLQYWDEGTGFELETILREVLFVPPSMRVLDLLLQMRDTSVHMAIVVDEYGGTDGMATIEDLVEEIVGEIEEEHEAATAPRMEERPDGSMIVDARLPIEEFEVKAGPLVTGSHEEGDVDTLGGFVSVLAGRVPVRGELVVHDASGLEFEVMDADPRRVKRLRVRNMPAHPAVHGD